jgi:5-methylcytosine-specific restriction endonuclease McrA
MTKDLFRFDSSAKSIKMPSLFQDQNTNAKPKRSPAFKMPSLFQDQNTDAKPKRSPCPQAVKEAVWKKYFGSIMVGKCYVCNSEITFTNFELGHNKPHSKGGEWVVSNLRPLCRTCNRSMGDKMTVEAFKKKYFGAKPKTVTPKTKRAAKPKSSTSKKKK